jgi:hypothetical protein
VIGENPAKGVYNDAANPTLVVPASLMFIGAYNKGWKGVMPWTSNGVDTNGNLNDFKDGLKAFKDAHPELIDPTIVSGMAPQLNQKKYSLIENIYIVQGNKQMAVVISDYENVILRLSDTMGRIVFQKKAESSNTLFPTENLTSGVYILAANKKGVIETRKFILY